MDQCPTDAGFPPAPGCQHQPGKWPADGAREPGDQGDPGDRPARLLAVDPGQRRKPRLVKPDPHTEPDDSPAREKDEGRRRHGEQPEARREDEIRQHQHAAPAKAVDPRSCPGPNHSRNHHRHGKRTEHPDRREAEVFGHGHSQNGGDVVAGSPADGEGRAEGSDNQSSPRRRQSWDHDGASIWKGAARQRALPLVFMPPASRAGTAAPMRRHQQGIGRYRPQRPVAAPAPRPPLPRGSR